jgi:hypothetical protein
MNRRIRVRAVRKEEPDIRLYVLALIALAQQLQEEEERQAVDATAPAKANRSAAVPEEGVRSEGA